MYLLQCCLAAVLLVTTTSAAVDVEKTVRQVQSILKTNTLLPRLSREEILGLLNDIRAEDAKSTSVSYESTEIKTTPYSTFENEITPETEANGNIVINSNQDLFAASSPSTPEITTKREPSLMVVLPYTPRDGSSLQELYTRPPRVERVPLSDITPKPVKILSANKIQAALTNNAKVAEKKKQEDFPAELQAFLDAHGLKGQPGKDHFLLPLDGFKPLPPAKVVDGSIQLPENILLTYDLISPTEDKSSEGAGVSTNNFLYEPLRPEYPFELDTSSSETKETIYPLAMPNSKGSDLLPPNFEPIDYESVKVIPLNKGLSPIEETKIVSESDQSKRQVNASAETTTTQASTTEESKTSSSETPKVADSSASADTDSGASIADLEDSFGGALPPEPGDSELPPPRKNGFYWMLDWNSFLEVGDGDTKVNIRFEPKLGDPQMFLPVTVP